MSFEKDFPSLTEDLEMWNGGFLETGYCNNERGDFTEKGIKEKMFNFDDIQKHCFDRQKVKEAIERVRLKYHNKALDSATVLEGVIRELGL